MCCEDVAQLLLAGFDVNAQDHFGETPLHMVARSGCHDTAKLLLQRLRLQRPHETSINAVFKFKNWASPDAAKLLGRSFGHVEGKLVPFPVRLKAWSRPEPTQFGLYGALFCRSREGLVMVVQCLGGLWAHALGHYR